MTGLERFLKVLPMHIHISERWLTIKYETFYAKNNCNYTTEEENVFLNEVVGFLREKIHDIEIDSIRHGVLTAEDYGKVLTTESGFVQLAVKDGAVQLDRNNVSDREWYENDEDYDI